ERCNARVIAMTGVQYGRPVWRGRRVRAHWGSISFGSNPDEVEGCVEVGDLRETNIVRIHGLNKVGTAEVKQAGIIGFGEALLERGQVHAAEVRIVLECSPDMNDEDLIVAEPSGGTFLGRGSNLLNEAREPGR